MSELLFGSARAVLFDHDDTTVESREAKWAQHKETAKRFYNRQITDDDLRMHWGKPLRELVCILYGTDNAEVAMANNSSLREQYPKVLFTETIPTIEYIQGLGIITGIVTATSRVSLDYDFTHLGIHSGLFDYTQTSDESRGHFKPHPNVFGPALEWLQTKRISASQTLYVGDSLHDMEAALGAGLQFVGVQTGLVTAEEFADYRVPSVATIGGLRQLIRE